MHFQSFDNFYPRAESLRAVFDKRFADPLKSAPDRFVWDFWHVPGEYTHLRTPAYHYFPQKLYESFHRFLVRFGREQLGCHDISPPWLSCYVEGCEQRPHRDSPHGPLAYVLSLSRGGFQGGETYWPKLRKKISPRFNRLVLFNPDLVHGVRKVRGTMDPRHGRLVLHGWFVKPRPFWTGPLTAAEVGASLDAGLGGLSLPFQSGFLSTRLEISKSGHVEATKILMNTLPGSSARHLKVLQTSFKALRFPKARSKTRLTLPLMVSP